MKKVYILYNPKAGKGTGEAEGKKLESYDGREAVFKDITKNKNYAEIFNGIESDAIVVVAGGDGTLSRFADSIAQLDVKNDIYYYATGSGNDFLKDLGYVKGEKPFPINEYIFSLPVIDTEGEASTFVNGVGGGLDAYACVEGNKAHMKGKQGNYVLSAIKGILYDYKPMNACVRVDGKDYTFKNVWFASVMKGRFFGGGIMLAPNQDRKSGKLSLVVVHNVGRLRILPIIPGAFSGKHIKYTKFVTVIEGNDFSVKFDKTVPLQIDGETKHKVSGYKVKSGACVVNW